MKKHDFILIAVILAVAAAVFCILHFTSSNGAYVTVQVDGKVTQTFSLSKDREYVIKSPGGGTNTLVIKDNKAYVSAANCKNQICVKHKKISKNGETIVCLPHKVVVSVTNDSEEGVDLAA